LTAIAGKAKCELCTAGAAVHIGGRDDPDDRFVPEIHATRAGWGDGTFLRIRHPDADKSQGEKHQIVKGVGKRPDLDAVRWQIGGRTHHFLQGSIEHTITYASAADLPAGLLESYAVDFPAGSLQWFLQGPLTDQETARGCKRPANVVGSYAVYGPRSGNLVDALGNPISSYETGKFCHVYPWTLSDAAGHSVGVPIAFDQASGQLQGQLPADFVNSATYPLTLDPTFGYDNYGGSEQDTDPNYGFCLVGPYAYTATAGDAITGFSGWFGSQGGAATPIYFAAYALAAGLPAARLAAAAGPVNPSADSETEFDVSGLHQSLAGGTTYGVAAYAATGGGSPEFYYDDQAPTVACRIADPGSGCLPATWADNGSSTYAFSVWATYAAAPTGGPFPHYTRRRLSGGMITMGE
jgi:hypothetical protein